MLYGTGTDEVSARRASRAYEATEYTCARSNTVGFLLRGQFYRTEPTRVQCDQELPQERRDQGVPDWCRRHSRGARRLVHQKLTSHLCVPTLAWGALPACLAWHLTVGFLQREDDSSVGRVGKCADPIPLCRRCRAAATDLLAIVSLLPWYAENLEVAQCRGARMEPLCRPTASGTMGAPPP